MIFSISFCRPSFNETVAILAFLEVEVGEFSANFVIFGEFVEPDIFFVCIFVELALTFMKITYFMIKHHLNRDYLTIILST